MDIKIYIPHPALQEYVLNISTGAIILPEGLSEVTSPYPPTPFQSLLFYCNYPISMRRNDNGNFEKQPCSVIVGPQFSRVNIRVHRKLSAIRVDFCPGGLYRLLGVPMHKLFDEGFDAFDFFGAGMKQINEQLQNTADLEEGKNIVEKFLLGRLTSLKKVLPFDAALNVLLKNDGNISVDKIASLSCVSVKQFERLCKERIGMNPKLYARILRFSKAYRLHEALPDLSWTKIAYEAGYYDQMHMIRDFKVFAGANPTVIEQQLRSTTIRMQKDLPF